MTLLTTSKNPSFGISSKKSYRTLVNSFGDGYEQIVADGLNNKVEEWSLTWELNGQEAEDLQTQIDSFEGLPFDWVTPNGETKRFSCKELTKNYVNFDYYTITAIFKENFS